MSWLAIAVFFVIIIKYKYSKTFYTYSKYVLWSILFCLIFEY